MKMRLGKIDPRRSFKGIAHLARLEPMSYNFQETGQMDSRGGFKDKVAFGPFFQNGPNETVFEPNGFSRPF